eukprot:2947388-Rhodomonas_salina.2
METWGCLAIDREVYWAFIAHIDRDKKAQGWVVETCWFQYIEHVHFNKMQKSLSSGGAVGRADKL